MHRIVVSLVKVEMVVSGANHFSHASGFGVEFFHAQDLSQLWRNFVHPLIRQGKTYDAVIMMGRNLLPKIEDVICNEGWLFY